MATDVVIIEDEPLIALDLEQLVTDLGHRVVKIARTAEQAVEAVQQPAARAWCWPTSIWPTAAPGLDAVNEILRTILAAGDLRDRLSRSAC